MLHATGRALAPAILLPPDVAQRLQRRHGPHWQQVAQHQIAHAILPLAPDDFRAVQAAARALHVPPDILAAAILDPHPSHSRAAHAGVWWSQAPAPASRAVPRRPAARQRAGCSFSLLLLVVGLLVGMWCSAFVTYTALVPAPSTAATPTSRVATRQGAWEHAPRRQDREASYATACASGSVASITPMPPASRR